MQPQIQIIVGLYRRQSIAHPPVRRQPGQSTGQAEFPQRQIQAQRFGCPSRHHPPQSPSETDHAIPRPGKHAFAHLPVRQCPARPQHRLDVRRRPILAIQLQRPTQHLIIFQPVQHEWLAGLQRFLALLHSDAQPLAQQPTRRILEESNQSLQTHRAQGRLRFRQLLRQ